jgi:hypothetical protein
MHRKRKSGRPRLSDETRREKQLGIRFRPDEMALLDELLSLDASGSIKIAALVRDAAVEHAIRSLRQISQWKESQERLREKIEEKGTPESERASLRLHLDGARQQEQTAIAFAIQPRAFGVVFTPGSQSPTVIDAPVPIRPVGVGVDGRLEGSGKKEGRS